MGEKEQKKPMDKNTRLKIRQSE